MGVIGEIIAAIAEVIIALLYSLYEIIAWPFRLLARGLRKLAELILRFAHWLSGGREPTPIARLLGWIITLLLLFWLIAFTCRKISSIQAYGQVVNLIGSVLQEQRSPSVALSTPAISSSSVIASPSLAEKDGSDDSPLAAVTPSLVAPISVSSTQPFYFNEFDQTHNEEWSDRTVSTSPSGESFLGEFGNQTITLRLDNLPAHSQIDLSFDLYIIRSWDGNGPEGPDVWSLVVDANQALLNTTFVAVPGASSAQAYPDDFPGGANLPATGAVALNQLGYDFRGVPADAIFKIHRAFPHTASSLRLAFSATGLQGLADESWGIDNVRLDLSSSPTAPTQKEIVPFPDDTARAAPEFLKLQGGSYDMWADCNNAQNVLLRNLPNTFFEIETRLILDSAENYQQGALLVYRDQDNWIKLDVVWSDVQGGLSVEFILEEDGATQDWPWIEIDPNSDVYLMNFTNLTR